MAEENFEQGILSIMIFITLNTIGFDREWILHKSKVVTKYFKHSLRIIEHLNPQIDCECVGSAAEGVSLSDSDCDCMIIMKDTFCVDTAYICKGFNVLETDYTNAAPGYVKLVFLHGDEDSPICVYLQQSELYKTRLGSSYISSPIFMNFLIQNLQTLIKIIFPPFISKLTSNGPAITSGSNDNALAIYFYGGCHLNNLSKRLRYYHWPSVSLIQEITSMEGYVVPVGHKFSDSQNIEWRVCYTTAELKLIKSLTDVQLKFYVLLKCVAKEIVKKNCKDITSYIVKNVVFWIVETEPEQAFTPTHLVKLLKKAIMFIKYCLQNNHLPNYMIPERNLIRENMNGKEKRKIIKDLKEYEDFAILLGKVPKLCQCMSFVYQIFELPQINLYKEWRKQVGRCLQAMALCKVEKVQLNMLSKRTVHMDMTWEFFKDIRFWPIMTTLLDLTVPDWMDLAMWWSIEHMLQLFLSRINACPCL
ncbi:uncharacterized protein LOC132749292 [Ruditapes philippinarum]|uniref:uncharacterized protein LOC132749292 n=1 Tax=Ruditapes philippinarum TaxID=129788 RepID=UPI00295BD380|nr:uncharacterized protein LOC132749292 [Ruditapes philippinarum]